MTPHEFKQARHKLGLTSSQLAKLLGVEPRTIRKWEASPELSTARPPSPIAVKAVGWFLNGFRPKGWPKNRV